ncbi:YhgE/Pip domain-containing protein [Sutcliffiella halmapala]|uniref:YhgE/Pip domain-containing protein n=1 Tax=Sutcliffiella halmapala TaxID=79882 RepID=UPI000995DC1E|nr:YhgE/Pip domain-containing protein [Sutcliffiella halmapala]
MNKFIGSEWKDHFSNKKILIPVLAVLFIPLLYSGMFLWAFWDPYERLDDLPVAVVNLDEGAEFESETLAIGEDLVDNLKNNPAFEWEFVSKDEAYAGLEKQRYYMVIEIPEDFSKRATTLLDEQPIPMELKYIPNESYNFLSSQIGSTAVEKIKEEVSNELVTTYAEEMFTNIETMAEGFQQATDGTKELNEGISKLRDGSSDLKAALLQAAEKSITFSTGIESAYGGVQELYVGNAKLANGLGQLQEGHQSLADGTNQLLEGMKGLQQGSAASQAGLEKAYTAQQELFKASGQLAEGAKKLSGGGLVIQTEVENVKQKSGQLSSNLKEFQQLLQPMLAEADENERALVEAYLQEIIKGSEQFSQGLGALGEGVKGLQSGLVTTETSLSQLAEGEKQLASGLSELVNGADQLAKGSNELLNGQTEIINGMSTFGGKLAEATQGSQALTQGGQKLLEGMGELENGSKQFQTGTAELAKGSETLNQGIQQVGEGTQELETKLSDAAEKAGGVKGNEDTYGMFADPVKVKSEVVNEVPNYGTGFAPYFLSLGLFVGALLLSIVYPLRETEQVPTSGTGWFLGKFSVLATVGVAQALLADAVLLLGLGIEVQSVPLFILFSIITSLSFIALIQFLVTLLGDPGRFVAIIILILQLTTSAGTFPLELIPGSLQIFHALLPMTYSVAGFKAVISSGDYAFMWQNAAILFGYITVLIAGTWMYFIRKFRKEHRVIEG